MIVVLLMSTVFSFIESTFLKYKLSKNITTDLTIFNLIPAVSIFILSLILDNSKIRINTRILRKMADIIYIIHVLVIKIFVQKSNLNNFKIFILSYFISLILSYIIIKFQEYIKIKNYKNI